MEELAEICEFDVLAAFCHTDIVTNMTKTWNLKISALGLSSTTISLQSKSESLTGHRYLP